MNEIATATVLMLNRLLEERTGQQIKASRVYRIETSLAPVLREWNLPNVDQLAASLATKADYRLADRVVDALLNNETSFYRDQGAFTQVTGTVFEKLREQRQATRRVRIWSAGCSTGQEALSLAIAVADNHPQWTGWTIDILGTDISASAITRARSACYTHFEIQRGLPVSAMVRHFRQDGTNWIASDHVRRMIRYSQRNLLDPVEDLGRFDLILCRNVLMYLAPDKRRQAFDRLASACADDGLLMLGAAETVIGQTERFRASDTMRGLYDAVPEAATRPGGGFGAPRDIAVRSANG